MTYMICMNYLMGRTFMNLYDWQDLHKLKDVHVQQGVPKKTFFDMNNGVKYLAFYWPYESRGEKIGIFNAFPVECRAFF